MPRQVVVDLGNVSRLSSGAIGVLVAHEVKLRRLGGALRVCQAKPGVLTYLDQIRLPLIVDYYPMFEDAILSMWS